MYFFDMTNDVILDVDNFDLSVQFSTTQFNSSPAYSTSGTVDIWFPVTEKNLNYFDVWNSNICDPETGRIGLKKDYARDIYLYGQSGEVINGQQSLRNVIRNSFVTDLEVSENFIITRIMYDYCEMGSINDLSKYDDRLKRILRKEKIKSILNEI